MRSISHSFFNWWKTGFDTNQGFLSVEYTELLLEFSQHEVSSKGWGEGNTSSFLCPKTVTSIKWPKKDFFICKYFVESIYCSADRFHKAVLQSSGSLSINYQHHNSTIYMFQVCTNSWLDLTIPHNTHTHTHTHTHRTHSNNPKK